MKIEHSFLGPDEPTDDVDLYVMQRHILETEDPENELLKLLDHPIIAVGQTCAFGFADAKEAADILIAAADSMESVTLVIAGDDDFNKTMHEEFERVRARKALMEQLMSGPTSGPLN